jgi:hypothetical protein
MLFSSWLRRGPVQGVSQPDPAWCSVPSGTHRVPDEGLTGPGFPAGSEASSGGGGAMWVQARRWLRPSPGPVRGRRAGCRAGRWRPLLEALEPRLAPSDGGFGPNAPVTTDSGVQQMPSVAVDPHDPAHVVIS